LQELQTLKAANQVNRNTIRAQNEMLSEQAKTIWELRAKVWELENRNKNLGDACWHYYLLSKMFAGLLGFKEQMRWDI